MVAHLLFGHRRIRRHERSGERTELADDLGLKALSDFGCSAAGMSTSGVESPYGGLRSRR